MPSSVAETLRALASALDGLGLDWYVFGAQAALVRGSRRLTEDLDVTVFLGDRTPEDIRASLGSAGFTLRVEDVDDFVATTRVLPFVHEVTRMPVDLVLAGPGLEEMLWQDSERLSIGGVLVHVPIAEHLIVTKLLAGRPNDFVDAVAMARANDVDFDAIEQLVTLIADSLGENDVVEALAELHRRLAKKGR